MVSIGSAQHRASSPLRKSHAAQEILASRESLQQGREAGIFVRSMIALGSPPWLGVPHGTEEAPEK